MSATVVREQILAAIKTALATIDGVNVERNRMNEVGQWPYIVVRGGDMAAEDIDSVSVEYSMQVEVEIFAQAASGEALESELNRLYGESVLALIADRTFGGLAQDTTEESLSPIMEISGNNRSTGAYLLVMVVQFFTSPASPFVSAP